MESQADALWRRLLREGELVFIGYCNPSQCFVEEGPEQTMTEFFLTRKLQVDRRAVKLRVKISVVKEKPHE